MSIKIEYIEQLKNDVSLALKKIGINDDSPIYEIPPSKDLGNIAFPMFKYTSMLKQNPFWIAQRVKENLIGNPIIEKKKVNGAYLNFFYNTKIIALEILSKIIKKGEKFGRQNKINKRVVLEFSSPNTNKPLHLGHCRNNVLGDSIAKILSFTGYDVTKVNLINDRGIHICKSMLAYKKFGNNTTPEKENIKSDHFVGNYYVKYNQEVERNKSFEKKAQEMLWLWEEKEKNVIDLCGKMNNWAIDGIRQTYKRMGIEFNEYEYESINYLFGKEIVKLGLNKKILYLSKDNSVWIDNEDIGLDKKIILRSDGTSVYITQDLGTAVKRYEKYKFDRMIYIVGSEQEYHFKTLFAILKKFEFKWVEKCAHLSYGMVNLPDGKMKSRQGTVIDADNLMDILYNMSYEVIESKERPLNDSEKKEIANKISLAALKYYLLNFSTTKDILFIAKESISFDGNTGPYLQYTTARLNSLFLKNNYKISVDDDFIDDYDLNEDEQDIILQFLEYENAIKKASEKLAPVEICNYLYNLARLYNKFYHDHPILKAKTKQIINIRLIISKAVYILLKNGLDLLGISSIKKM